MRRLLYHVAHRRPPMFEPRAKKAAFPSIRYSLLTLQIALKACMCESPCTDRPPSNSSPVPTKTGKIRSTTGNNKSLKVHVDDRGGGTRPPRNWASYSLNIVPCRSLTASTSTTRAYHWHPSHHGRRKRHAGTCMCETIPACPNQDRENTANHGQ